MKVYIEKQDKHITIKFRGTAKKLLKQLKINSQQVLVSRNGALITEDEQLKDTDSIILLSVISGG